MSTRTSTHLAEREEPLRTIADRAAAARLGTGHVLLLTGATGTGRTALLTEAARRAAADGTTVLRARCSAEETATPYAAARQLFDTGPAPVGPHGHTPWGGAPGTPAGTDPDAAEATLWSLLRLHGTHHPLLLAVDDVHLADEPSRRWLRQVARRIDRLPALLIATERRQATLDTPPDRFTRSVPPDLATTLRLAPLSTPAAVRLAREHLGPGLPAGLAADCARASGGNPLLLTALLADLAAFDAATRAASGPPTGGAGPGTGPDRFPAALPAPVAEALPARRPDPDGPCRHPGGLPDALPEDCGALPGSAFAEAVDAWLHGAGDHAVTAARVLARMREHHTGITVPAPGTPPLDLVPLLADLTGADPGRLSGWLADLAVHRHLETPGPGRWPRLAHPLLGAAVLTGHAPGHRADVHLAAAEHLHRTGAPDELVAGHLLLTPAPTPRWAADALRRAARQAAEADHPTAATALLRRVLAEPLSDRLRGPLLTELGGLEVTLGPAERTVGLRHLAEAVHLQQTDEGVFRAANTLGAVLATRGDTAAALELMDELAHRFDDQEDVLHAVQAATAQIAAHDGRSWLQVVEGVQRLAARTPQRLAPPAFALLTEFDATSGLLSATEVAERVRELDAFPVDPLCRSYLLVSLATLSQWADLLDQADEITARGFANYRGGPLDPGYQCLLSVRAETRIMRGEYQALLDDYGLTAPGPDAAPAVPPPLPPPPPALLQSTPWGPPGLPGLRGLGGRATVPNLPATVPGRTLRTGGAPVAPRPAADDTSPGRYAELLGQQNAHLVAQAVIALVETGRLWQAHGLARAVAADRAQGSWEWNEYLYARGLLRLASGEPAEALADLLECGRRQAERQVRSPIVTPWRSAAAECHLQLGAPGPAVALAEEELRLARVWGTPRTVGRALRVLAAATGGRHGLDLASEAVHLLRTAEIDTELIPALITYGRLLGDGGRRGAARRTLREAAGRAERLGAVRQRAAALESLRTSGARIGRGDHAGAEALTDSELRICRLAAAGHSNAEIAAMLHLAVRTVETHLTNSFRKLGVRRRLELSNVLEA
ncbi:AAA family ATPase [Kitasatospora sp. NPDC056327]|uniref:helix-turn-helix transcriptional regulator n=1 Tax=Kitasatospora sp. NPDC056327 TaxID=3345785 RepID=UPI0035D83CF2